jgi:hypothetical protein
VTVSVAACRACGKLTCSGGIGEGVGAGADQVRGGLVDGEQGPHLLGDPFGVLAAQHGHAFAQVGLVVSDHGLGAPPRRVGTGQVQPHNIRVHLFTCVLALQIAHLMRRHAHQHGLHLSVRELLDHLAGIQETVLLYPCTGGRPKARRMLTETTRPKTTSPKSST